VVVCACHPNHSRKPKIEGSRSNLAWEKARPYLQNSQRKARAGVMAQAVEHEALSSTLKPPPPPQKNQEVKCFFVLFSFPLKN
jgi:hypothetical protein